MRLDFSQEFLNQVKQANDIIEVASEYFSLEESRGLYRAHCKHPGGDKTPSLTFFPDTQTFYCFGCHAGQRGGKTDGSDVISFVQWIEGLSWQDAVMYLANKKGIKVPDAELSKEDRAKQQLYDKAMTDNRSYWAKLQSNKDVLQWFYGKGMTDADIAQWRLGVDQGVPTYAVMDDYGRTVAFSRRLDKQGSKYVNDSTNDIFKKGTILYGLNFVKKLARQHKFLVLVEGFNDVIALQKYGIPAVALMGTSLADGQIALIKKYVDKVILFLDGDAAGIDSTIEHIRTLKAEKIEVEVVNILGFDPDDVANKYKEDTLKFILDNKRLAFQFLITNVLDKYFDSMIRLKKETLAKLEDILQYIDDDGERQLYRKQLTKVIAMEERDDL